MGTIYLSMSQILCAIPGDPRERGGRTKAALTECHRKLRQRLSAPLAKFQCYVHFNPLRLAVDHAMLMPCICVLLAESSILGHKYKTALSRGQGTCSRHYL